MQGYKIEFSIYANSPEEAASVSKALGQFVDDCAREGIAVRASRIIEIITKWGKSPVVRNFIK